MRRAFALLAGGLLTVTALQGSQSPADTGELPELLARVAESVERYYARAQSIMCIETVRMQGLGHDLLSDASPSRRLDYELRVAWDPATDGQTPEANIVRQLIKVNGRPPRPKDEPQCMDPKDVATEPLSMFLPGGQDDLLFTMAGTGKVNGRRATMVDFKSKAVGEATLSAKKDCISFSLPGRERGRAWIDAETGEVLRLDTRLTGMVDFTLPRAQQHPGGPVSMTVERFDSSIVYKPVAFAEPEEILMLPASINTLSVIRNSGAPRMRTIQDFSHYQRFITGGRVVSTETPEPASDAPPPD